MGRTLPAIAKGWLRGFKNKSGSWGNASTATIFETGNEEDTVCGTVVKMTPEEVKMLDPYEGYPWLYYRKVVKLTAYMVMGGTSSPMELDSQAYIIQEEKYNNFVEPI